MNFFLRIWLIFLTELKRVKSGKAFHLVAIASPLLFLYAFAGNLAQDISFPVIVKNESTSSDYEDFLPLYKSPQGTPYFSVKEPDKNEYPCITIKQDIKAAENVSGHIQLYIPAINTNVTKNYQNRVTGSIISFLHRVRPATYISIKENPLYKTEPSWMQFFSVTILVLGLWLSGMLFGSLAFSSEWQNNRILYYKLSPFPVALPLAGKLLAGLLKSGIVLCIYFLTSYAMGIILVPRIVVSLGVFALITISSLCTGMIIGILCGEVIIAFIFSLLGAIILWITGGGFGTSLAIHPLLRNITECNPVTWCIRLAQHAFFSGPFYVKDIMFLSVFTVFTGICLLFIYKRVIYTPGKGAKK